MGTKNNPGDFDCYAEADPDEPMFILLGRDPMAPKIVEAWANLRETAGDDERKIREARHCAALMRDWLLKIGRSEPHANIVTGCNVHSMPLLKGRIKLSPKCDSED